MTDNGLTSPAVAMEQLETLIQKVRTLGADAADAIWADATAQSVAWREGKVESLDRSEGGSLSLRVLIGKKQAVVSTSDRRETTLEELAARAVAMAKASPEDPFCGLADPSDLTHDYPSLEMADDFCVTPAMLLDRAREAEDAARAISGVTRIEETGASAGLSCVTLVTSHGFAGHYQRTHYGVSASALAGDGLEMEQESDYASRVFWNDLPSAALIGKRAGERAVRQLGARKMKSCQVPVIFEPREAAGFLGILAGSISGPSIARGTSFLKNDLQKQIFPTNIQIIDDPFLARGLRSRAFDGEGVLPQKRSLIENGVLTTWLLDSRSARQLGLKTTGHASRGSGGLPSPSPTNLYMAEGSLSVEDLIRDIPSGFYVTGQMGDGVNGVTGDYSLAAKGIWIENGKLAFPVSEVTIAGNLRDMFAHMTPASDLHFEDGFNAPTLRIDGMTVAGS